MDWSTVVRTGVSARLVAHCVRRMPEYSRAQKQEMASVAEQRWIQQPRRSSPAGTPSRSGVPRSYESLSSAWSSCTRAVAALTTPTSAPSSRRRSRSATSRRSRSTTPTPCQHGSATATDNSGPESNTAHRLYRRVHFSFIEQGGSSLYATAGRKGDNKVRCCASWPESAGPRHAPGHLARRRRRHRGGFSRSRDRPGHRPDNPRPQQVWQSVACDEPHLPASGRVQREAQLIEHARRGLSNAEIADRVVISTGTVDPSLPRDAEAGRHGPPRSLSQTSHAASWPSLAKIRSGLGSTPIFATWMPQREKTTL
jgi:hypothetical protein